MGCFFLSMTEECSKFFFIRKALKTTILSSHFWHEYGNLTFNETVCTIFWKHFSFEFDFQCNHSVEKVVLFRSIRSRARYLVPFRSYTRFSESREIHQMILNMARDRGNRSHWVEVWCLFSVLQRFHVTSPSVFIFQHSAAIVHSWYFKNLCKVAWNRFETKIE
jgi:hypothetical protein